MDLDLIFKLFSLFVLPLLALVWKMLNNKIGELETRIQKQESYLDKKSESDDAQFRELSEAINEKLDSVRDSTYQIQLGQKELHNTILRTFVTKEDCLSTVNRMERSIREINDQ